MSLPSLSLNNQGENAMGGANAFLKDYNSNQNANLGNRAFGKELTNYGRADSNVDQLKSYNLRSKNSRIQQGVGIKSNISQEGSMSTKMKVESLDEKDLYQREESTKDYLKTLLGADTQVDELDSVDLPDVNNPQYVCEYVNEVMAYLRETEEKYAPKPGAMNKTQTDINEKMRAILIDWLVDVHLKFKLIPETFFLTINIIDRFLASFAINRQKLQLVGVAAMLIAAKYEEIYPPEVKDFEYVTDKAYSREDILDMEGKIIAALNFNLTTPSSYRFLERYAKVAGFDEKAFQLARYLLELATVEYKMIKYLPSNIACSAVYLVNKIHKKEGWSDLMIKHGKYSETQIRPCAKDLCILLQNASKSNLQAVKRKFSSTKYLEVAKIQLDKI
jgi:cyclin B